MKLISESKAIERLSIIRSELRSSIAEGYEHRARSCDTCTTPGACCLDEHFVNVRITRLEAAAIRKAIDEMPDEAKHNISVRAAAAIEKYSLDDGRAETFACPLYEAGSGCLVHSTAKPLPCIVHACYDRASDLPPDDILAAAELAVAELNGRVYREPITSKPIPLAIQKRY